ncbi:LuxR C-terminal-related transcriptional regulator [Candidatus Uabimicrobium sp. HlEnr_7]|uniref:LuxR C-terminal-related transcriptional regulator n=1 Tax=Candidatus Uabimicrobium helgolandensis TaxID=3095367 RepID=UPI0035586300
MILEYKLYKPQINKSIRRERAIQKIDLNKKLNVVCAPAGYGKTTAVIQKLAKYKNYSWFTIDKSDNALKSFFSYVEEMFVRVLRLNRSMMILQSANAYSPEFIADTLLRKFRKTSQHIYLIFEDYHYIDNNDIHRAMNFLLEHLSPKIHIIIITRHELPFAVSRMRVQGEVAEIDIKDLQFSYDEVKHFFCDLYKMKCSDNEIANIFNLTEGWPVALKLITSITKNGQIPKLENSKEQIITYLLDEVLHTCPKPIYDFLMYTSIFEHLQEEVCLAVVLHLDFSLADKLPLPILEYLEKQNVFIVAVDRQKNIYRYHHLFRELLNERLKKWHLSKYTSLHTYASKCYVEQQYFSQAIHHAICAKKFDLAAGYIDSIYLKLLYQEDFYTLVRWVKLLPHDTLCKYSRLCCTYVLLLYGKEQFLELKVLSELAKNVEYTLILKALYSSYSGDQKNCISLATSVSQNDCNYIFLKELVLFLLAHAHHDLKEWAVADDYYQEVFNLNSLTKNNILRCAIVGYWSELQIDIGHYRSAYEILELEAKKLQVWNGESCIINEKLGTLPAHILTKMANILYLQNDLAKAQAITEHIWLIFDLEEQQGDIYIAYLLKMQLAYASGEVEKICHWIQKIEKLDLCIEPTATWAYYTVLYYKLQLAQKFPHMSFLSEKMQKVTCYIDSKRANDFAIFLNVKLYIIRGKLDDALLLVNKLISQSEKYLLLWSLIVKSSILYSQKNIHQATKVMEQAIEMAAPQGIVRPFLEEGNRFLIEKVQKHSQFVKLLVPTPNISKKTPGLLQPLNTREREILFLLCKSYTYKRIAEELYLSINTVKWYLKIIYEKLMVSNRKQAVKKAYELNLF